MRIGDTLTIGEAKLTIAGILGQQPDRLADRLAYGPKVLMSLDTLARTGLVQPGSLIRWTYRLKLPGDEGQDKRALIAARSAINAAFPESGFDIHDWTDPAPSIRRDARRFTQFISFVGLTALLLGGIGVGNAIGSYMAKKRGVIATFKCLGASSRLVLKVYLLQAFMLAGLGIALGLVIGALTPALLAARYAEVLPIPLAIEPHAGALLTAALAGLLTMLLFVLWPLGRASRIPPAVMMRAHLTDEDERPALSFAAGAAHRRRRAVRARHPCLRRAPHHERDLRRHRGGVRRLHRFRLGVAEARGAAPARTAAVACASRSRASPARARSPATSPCPSASVSACSSPWP